MNDPLQDMRSACHALAAQIMHTSASGNRCKWLREHLFELLKDPSFIEATEAAYGKEYPYAGVRSAYLAEVLKAYDEEV